MTSSTAIFEALISAGVTNEGVIRLVDGEYSLPSIEWVSDMGKRFSRFLFHNGIELAEERADCDEFSFLCAGLAKLDHARFANDRESGLAFGIAHFWTETVGHAANIAIHRENGELTVKLYEPQRINGLCLTPIDLSSVRLWRLCYL